MYISKELRIPCSDVVFARGIPMYYLKCKPSLPSLKLDRLSMRVILDRLFLCILDIMYIVYNSFFVKI